VFADVIALYRAAGRPKLAGERFSFQGPADAALDGAVQACERLALGFGHFADGPDRDDGELDFTWALSSNEAGRFYASVDDFVARCESIHRGEFPENFYIAGLNYFSGETSSQPVPELQTIERFCELIRLLATLSVSGNLAAVAGRPTHLLFVKPASSGAPPVTVEFTTRLHIPVLSTPSPDVGVLRDLLSDEAKGKVRTEEYKAIFRLAIAGTCAEEPTESARFALLTDKWDAVLQRFRYDVECIVDRMSFDALRREITEAELTFVGKVNASVVDNAAKFLGIPLSLAAVAAVTSGDSITSDSLVCLGAVVVALVVSGVSKATRLQLKTTDTAFAAALKSMRDRAQAGGDVAGSLDTLADTYTGRRTFAAQVVATFQTLAWLPPVVALIIIGWKFPPPWLASLLS
jgi:hypothetical protein